MTSRDRFLAAIKGQPVDRVPVWMMRQAGRYLPAYQAVKANHDFLTMCRTPALAKEITIQPMRELAIDALIFFSDILIPLDAIQIPISFDTGKPEIPKPLTPGSSLENYWDFQANKIDFVMEGLQLVRQEVGFDKALLGFAGAPFTLAMYLIQGGGSKDFSSARAAVYHHADWFSDLITCLTDMTISYLKCQTRCGVDAVQLFDSWAGWASRETYQSLILPSYRRIFQALNDETVTILYSQNTAQVLDLLGESHAKTISVDWRIPLGTIHQKLPKGIAVQGNLDPCILLAPEAIVRHRARQMMIEAKVMEGWRGYVANLGHGILPETPVSSARAFIETVHEFEWSE